MAIGFPAGVTATSIVNNAQQRLAALRNSLEGCEDFYRWLIGQSPADLEAAPVSMDAASVEKLFSAFADANAIYLIYSTGLPPGTYPQPESAYDYSASQRAVIGPL